jgi:hypothetical protein
MPSSNSDIGLCCAGAQVPVKQTDVSIANFNDIRIHSLVPDVIGQKTLAVLAAG